MIAELVIGPSLLPYLNSYPTGISLQLALSEQRFPVQDEDVPFSILRQGCVMVGGHHRLMDVMFVTQSDFYAGVHSELRPLTNPDAEFVWQQTWTQIKKQDDETCPSVLPCQIDATGALAPLRSLFYCSHRALYCHPLCPACGTPLDLCCNDDFLETAGLPAYSKSLSRFLYCADCHDASDNAYFYARHVTGACSARVKDSNALIEAFSLLLSRSDLSDQLPCIGCAEAANCFGPDMLVLNRMQPLQFYPFHMLMQQAPTLNALDFLALVSGAKSRKLPQVKSRGFLFEQDDRLFMEILYLKLTFLQELIALINSDVFVPVSRMSLDGIGVDMKTQGAHLPHFWNFSLRLVNPIGKAPPHPAGSDLPYARIHEFLGHAWFYVLLVNETQQMMQLNAVFDEHLVKGDNRQVYTGELFDHSAFDPGHIFWQPGTIELAPDWQTLWRRALEMGLSLLRAGAGTGSDFSPAAFAVRLEKLKNQVHQCLFKTPPVVQAPASKTSDAANGRIAAILSNIREQWPQSGDLPATDNDELARTVISMAPQLPAVRENLEKTVFISPSQEQPAAPETSSPANAADAGQSNKTVEEGLEETIIAYPGQGKAGKAGS